MIGATKLPQRPFVAPVAFQSPIHRGDRCNVDGRRQAGEAYVAFSPLFIGVIGATVDKDEAVIPVEFSFSPLFIGVIGATYNPLSMEEDLFILSVPYSSG